MGRGSDRQRSHHAYGRDVQSQVWLYRRQDGLGRAGYAEAVAVPFFDRVWSDQSQRWNFPGSRTRVRLGCRSEAIARGAEYCRSGVLEEGFRGKCVACQWAIARPRAGPGSSANAWQGAKRADAYSASAVHVVPLTFVTHFHRDVHREQYTLTAPTHQ